MEISKEQWADWKNHPVTLAFFEALKEDRNMMMAQIASGGTINYDSADSTLANTAVRVGYLNALEKVLQVTAYIKEEEEPDAEGKD